MAVGLTGVTAKSFSNLQLDAGVFVDGLDITTIKDMEAMVAAVKVAITDGKCLGATSGGMTFSSIPEMRSIELDGMRQDFKGSLIRDKTVVTIETTLTEVTPDNLQKILASTTYTVTGTAADGNYMKIRERLNLDPDMDYIDKLTWVGDLLDGRLAAIMLNNCINTNGLTWTAADKGNATFPVTFTATNANFDDRDYAPYTLMIFLPKITTTTP